MSLLVWLLFSLACASSSDDFLSQDPAEALSLLQQKTTSARSVAAAGSDASAEAETGVDASVEAERPGGSVGQAMGEDIVDQLQDLVGDDSTHKVKLTSTVVVTPGRSRNGTADPQNPQNMQIKRTLVVHQEQDVASEAPEDQETVQGLDMGGAQPDVNVPKVLAGDVKELKRRADEGENATNLTELSAVPTFEGPSPEEIRERRALAAMRMSASNMVKRLDSMITDAELIRDAFSEGQGGIEVKKMIPPIAFIKTHRTGSSTVSSILHRIGDERDLRFFLPGNQHTSSLGWPASFPGKEATTFNGQPAQQFDLICHTAIFNENRFREYLKPNPFIFATLRLPSKQIASAFDFFSPPCDNDWEERIEWLKKLSHGEARLADHASSLRAQFLNPQACDLGWYEHAGVGSEGGAPAADRDEIAIGRWIASLERDFGLVILAEYFDEGLVLLKRKLGLDIKDVQYVYKRRGGEHEELSKKQEKTLNDLLPVDSKLYEHFNRTFWQEWEDAGGYTLLADELTELQLRNEALEDACEEKDRDVCAWTYSSEGSEFTEYLKSKQQIIIDAQVQKDTQ